MGGQFSSETGQRSTSNQTMLVWVTLNRIVHRWSRADKVTFVIKIVNGDVVNQAEVMKELDDIALIQRDSNDVVLTVWFTAEKAAAWSRDLQHVGFYTVPDMMWDYNPTVTAIVRTIQDKMDDSLREDMWSEGAHSRAGTMVVTLDLRILANPSDEQKALFWENAWAFARHRHMRVKSLYDTDVNF